MINSSQVQVKTLSSLSWNTIDLKSNYNTLQLQDQKLNFTNGVTFNVPHIFLNTKDVSVNNNSIIILASNHTVNNIFKETSKNIDSKTLLNRSSLRVYKDIPKIVVNSFIKTKGVQTTIPTTIQEQSKYSLVLSTANNRLSLQRGNVIKDTEIFNFEFKRSYVSLRSSTGLYLTDRDTFVQLLPKSNVYSQRFQYILNDRSILLFKYGSNFTLLLNLSINTAEATFISINSLNDIPEECHLYIDQLKDLPNNFNSIQDSFIAKYNTNPLSASNSLDLDKNIQQLNYKQEYLINIPLNSYNNYTHTAYINSLKNYQTSNYNYSLIDNNANKREYTNVFTGTKQSNGYGNIYLNFKSNTLEKIFPKDAETTFHYPATISTDGIYLSASELIQEGAVSGKNPFTSDRVMLSRRDYRELNIPTLSAVIADNTWMYSWLSAGDSGESQWVDRYYRGANYDLTQQEYLLYTINDPLVVDEPSTMKFLPNRVYKYFHQGQNNIKKYVDNLTNIYNDSSTKLLEIVDWSNNILTDTSIHHNDGLISLNNKNLSAEHLYLDGKSYALFPSTSSMQEDKQLYVGFWLHVEDWNQIEGSQIAGNYAEGGFGLFNRQAIPTTFITLYDNNHNYIYNINSNFKIVNEQTVSAQKSDKNNLPVYIVRNSEQSYWLINGNNLTASKFDLNNNLILHIDNLSPLKVITQVEVDDIERIYIVDNITQKIVIVDGFTGGIYTGFTGIDFPYKRLEISKKCNNSLTSQIVPFGAPSSRVNYNKTTALLIGIDGHLSVADNNGNIWYSAGINLYKNKSFYAMIGKMIQITCDVKNNIWILHDTNKITKINPNTNLIDFTLTYESAKIDTFPSQQNRFINFVSIKINNKETDFAIVIDNEEKVCYLINENGTLYNKVNLLILPSVFLSKHNFNRTNINFICHGDFTGYQYQRKFNNNNELLWKVKIAETAEETTIAETLGQVVYLPFSSAQLDTGWHYFSFVYDYARGNIQAYVDSVLVNSYKFSPFKFKIKKSYKPFCVGAITTDQGVLNDTIGMNDKFKIIAYFTNLHIYKYAFDEHDIKLLYKSTYIDLYKDLIWNINIGNRNYIEQIERFFMHKMPGSKSKYFNIKIKNFPVTKKQQHLIEQAIESVTPRIIPADTLLHKIIWE